ncbi:PREDICTED: putative mediator of RNA polymerase II transcription subunit 26 isoform X3 [Polistes canadensis]|uniref:putative mediator of RNA polymerase II transcription subunit 26 isoform X3 n=1 Tax=Polistes canadensis TaxID=91411 RepID=UPI000718BB5F|nr:PREDICTED: putative mediator of RNA polymerase II transcription subunit 26 isoform X3 [Polistes canadensis]
MDYRCATGTRYDDDVLENEKGLFGATANDNKGASKRGAPCTRGTAMSFGFRRRPTTGIPVPITNYATDLTLLHPRSKSAGPEQTRRRDDDVTYQAVQNSSSGRSTPRLAPPKKEATGVSTRTNRFGYRQAQGRFTNKVGDICNSHSVSHYNQERLQQHQQQQQQQQQYQQHESHVPKQQNRVVQVYNVATGSKLRANVPSAHNSSSNGGGNNNVTNNDANRRVSGIPESVTRYTLHASHLPLPQYAVRMNDTNSKIAKTVANQSRKISTGSKSSASSKEGSGTEDSGVSSHQSCPGESERNEGYDCIDGSTTGSRRGTAAFGRGRNLKMVVSGKSFDVRDVGDDDSTVTEISVIPLPKCFASPNLNTGLVRERATQYQRIVNKDNRYTSSITSMSTTSSEGYDEGLGEEKVYKDRSRTEKIPSIKSDFSLPSSDDPEYGHGEAMADEYSLSSSDECQQRSNSNSTQHNIKTISDAAKNGNLPKSTLRSVLLTIEDPAFAAAAATSTALIDDETSPVDSLFDSPTASITQSDDKVSKKECVMERSGNTIDDDSPGTPTNASNSLSLSEGKEFFDDEIADQPGLIFDDNSVVVAVETQSVAINQVVTENSHTLVESIAKSNMQQSGKNSGISPFHGKRISRAGSVDTLSPCESIASDDLMLDYERSDASSTEDTHNRLDSNPALHELDDATILSELEAQGEEVMRQWTSLLGTTQPTQQQTSNSNTVNNNINNSISNNNNHSTTESGIINGRNSRLLRSRSGAESPRSLDSIRSRQIPSPLRTPRSIPSPSFDSSDDTTIRIDRATFQYMFQDIVSLKTMLLKLKRVLQEPEALNPFDNTVKNGLFYTLSEGGTADVSTSPGSGESSIADELTDLRRQVIFLQGQVEDKDRTIQILQFQMTKLKASNGTDVENNTPSANCSKSLLVDMCNAATQTEKIRPVSAGPSLLQSLPQDSTIGPLVSLARWSDSRNCQRPSSLGELNHFRNLHRSTDNSQHILRQRQSQSQIVKTNMRRNIIRKSLEQENS